MDNECLNDLTHKIIGAAIRVHRILGPGLLESTYESCLLYEFEQIGLKFEQQKKLPIVYKGKTLDNYYRLDLIVESKVIVEIKSISELLQIHGAQLLSYLRLSNCKVGLLINFNVSLLKNGIHRIVNHY